MSWWSIRYPRMWRSLLSPSTADTSATVWVETDGPCEVGVLGHRARTFHVAGHHYAIVAIAGLEPGSTYEYEVLVDGKRAWPDPSNPFGPSRIRTLDPDRGFGLAFGSCRVAAPHDPPYVLERAEHPD